jgi:hypothetical protein
MTSVPSSVQPLAAGCFTSRPPPHFQFSIWILTLLEHLCCQGHTVGKQIRLAFARGRVHFFALAVNELSAGSTALVFLAQF